MLKFRLKIFLFINAFLFLLIFNSFGLFFLQNKQVYFNNNKTSNIFSFQNQNLTETDNYFPSLGKPKPNLFADADYPLIKIKEIKKNGIYIPEQEINFFHSNESRYFAETIYKYFAITPKELLQLPYEQYQYLNVFVQANPNSDYTIDQNLVSQQRQEIFSFAIDLSYEQVIDILADSVEFISIILLTISEPELEDFIKFFLKSFIINFLKRNKQFFLALIKCATYESFESSYFSNLKFFLNDQKNKLNWKFRTVKNSYKYRNIAQVHFDFALSNTLDEFIPELYKNCSWWQLQCHAENALILVRNTANRIKHFLDFRLDYIHEFEYWKKDLISSSEKEIIREGNIPFERTNFSFYLADLKSNQLEKIKNSYVKQQEKTIFFRTEPLSVNKRKNIFDDFDNQQPFFYRSKRKDKNEIQKTNPRFEQNFISPISDNKKYQLIFNPKIISIKKNNNQSSKTQNNLVFKKLLNLFNEKKEDSLFQFWQLLKKEPFKTLYDNYRFTFDDAQIKDLFFKFTNELKKSKPHFYWFYQYWKDVYLHFKNIKPDRNWNVFLNDHYLDDNFCIENNNYQENNFKISFANLNLDNLFQTYEQFADYPLSTVFFDGDNQLVTIVGNQLNLRGKIIKPLLTGEKREHLSYLPVNFELRLNNHLQSLKLKDYLSQFSLNELKTKFHAFSFVITSFYGDIIPLMIF